MIEIGVLFSTSGPYSAVGAEMLAGALMGIEEVNRSGEFDFELAATINDPGGDAVNYATAGREILSPGTVKHVIGCYTSWSRKEIIPVIEKYDALLWYPSHYEGFESCANTIYIGASPNQHIVPLARYMIQNHGANAYCCGSNYIWPWENNRVMRAMLNAAGGGVLTEKYLPIGSTDVDGFIDDIRRMKPDFIFNTLIGESSYEFFRKYYEVGLSDPTFRPETTPIVSCSLSEPELLQIGGLAAVGHIASSVYFETIDSQVNRSFIQRTEIASVQAASLQLTRRLPTIPRPARQGNTSGRQRGKSTRCGVHCLPSLWMRLRVRSGSIPTTIIAT